MSVRQALRGLRSLAGAKVMQQRERLARFWLAASQCWFVAVGGVRADSVASAVFVRADTDHTVVVSPRAHLAHQVTDATQIDVTYAADIWTSASVDIRAMATLPVTEQRDELDLGISHAFEDVSIAASYRYSIENDYVSHGVTASGTVELAQNNTTLALATYALMDTVGRSGQPNFSRGLTTLGAKATFTQIIDTQTLVLLTYELSQLNGYQSSPYRFVGVGGTGFGCEDATECAPEHLPAQRFRNALALVVRRALANTLAAGATYRLYFDDWDLLSHTLSAELSWMPGDYTRFIVEYRFYTQSGVYFYAPVYTSYRGQLSYTTRDREQSPLRDQRVGLRWIQSLPLDSASTLLRLHTSVGGVKYKYSDFRGLDTVQALELTLAVSLEH